MAIITPSAISGETSGVVGDLVADDASYVICAETTTTPGFALTVTYTGVGAGPYDVIFNGRYSHSASHGAELEIWNFSGTPAWDDVDADADDFTHVGGGADEDLRFSLPNPLADYVSGGELRLRIIHNDLGQVSAESLKVDRLVLDDDSTLYWVGADTSWNTSTNWATTAGGAGGEGGADVPGDGVLVDFDGTDDTNCTMDVAPAVLAGFTAQVGYAGVFDLATFDLTMDDGASIVLDMAGEFDMGTGTLTTTNFDNASVGTFTEGSSTLIMRGTGDIVSASGNGLFNLTIDVGATTTVTTSFTKFAGLVTVNGTLSLDSGKIAKTVGAGDVVIGPGGLLTGDGHFQLELPGSGKGISSFDPTGMIDVATLTIVQPTAASVVAAGLYDSLLTIVNNVSGNARVLTLSSGDYTFGGNLEFENTGAGSLTIANNTNNPNIELQGNLIWTETAGTLTYTKGTGDMTLSGLSNQNIELGDNASENLTISKPTAGDVTLVDVDLTIDHINMADNFFATSGDVLTDTNATCSIGGDMLLDNNAFGMGTDTGWAVGGDFDNSGVTTFDGGTSGLIMTGTAALVAKHNAALFNVTIAAGATITASAVGGTAILTEGTTLVDGELVVTVDDEYNVSGAELRLGSDGVISGDGHLFVEDAASGEGITVFPASANITVANMWLRYWETGAILAEGTYEPTAQLLFYADSAADSAVFDALDGTYIFNTPLVSVQAGVNGDATLDWDLSANNPAILCTGNLELVSADGSGTPSVLTITLGDVPIEVRGDIVLDATGTLNFTSGANADFNMTGTDNVFIDTDAVAIGSITINKPDGGNVEFTLVDLTIGGIVMAGLLQVTSGDVDTADAAVINIANDVLLDNNAFDMGDGSTWIVDAEFDNKDVTSFEPGTSSLFLTGASGSIRSAVGNELNAVTIATGALVTTLTDFGAETLTVNGTLQMGGDTVTFEDGLVFGAAGIIAGTSGTLVFNEPTGANAVVLAAATNIQVDVFQILDPDPTATPLPPGTYDTWLQIIGTQAGRVMQFDSGTYNVIGRLEYETTAGDLTIDNSANDPDFVIGGSGFSDLIFTPTGGSLVYTKGDGSYTLTESMAVESKGYDLEAIVVAAGTFTQSDDLDTVDGLTIQSGATWDCAGFDVVIANGGDLVVSGTMVGASLDAATFTVSGDCTLRGVDTSASTAEWFINATGNLVAYNVDLKNSNASGTPGIAYNSTDSGGNTNWTFRELPSGGPQGGPIWREVPGKQTPFLSY
jgi:hypothetical protein